MKDRAAEENQFPEDPTAIRKQVAALTASQGAYDWAEEALRTTLLQLNELRSIVNRSPVVVFRWRIDKGWPVEFVSENVEQFGYTAEDFISGRVAWTSILDQEDLPRLERETFQHIAEDITEFTQQYRLFTLSGDIRWIEDRNVVRRDSAGKATHIEAILLDITDRKQAEDARIESERRYHLISDSVTDAIWTAEYSEPIDLINLDDDGDAVRRATLLLLNSRFTHVSPSIRQLLGYTAEEILHLRLDQLVTPASCLSVVELFCDELTTDQFRIHTVPVDLFAKDGSLRHCEITGACLRNRKNQLVGMMGVVRDLTERLAAQRALAESEARLRNLVDQMPDYAAIIDRSGTIHFLNRSSGRMSVSDIVGKSVFDLIAPSWHPKAHEVLLQGFDRREVQTFVLPAFNGLWYECRLVPMLERDSVQQAIVIARDVTSRRQAEELTHILHDMAVALGAVSNLAEAATICLNAAMTASGMEASEFYIVTPDGGINLVTAIGISPDSLKNKTRFEADTLQARLVMEAAPIYVSTDALPDPMMREFCRHERLKAVSIVPVLHKGRSVACLGVASRTSHEFPPWVCRLLESIASQIGGVIARIQAEEELEKEQRLLRQLLDLHERERKLVAYEIHDGFVQPLTGALMTFEASQQRFLSQGVEGTRDVFQSGLRLLRDSIQEARHLISSLRPPILDDLGIVPAIEYLVCEGQVASKVLIDYVHQVQFERLTPPLETTIFRIVQESLTNALRHSRSDHVSVRLLQQGSRLRIEVEDRGVGFDREHVDRNRFGLRGIEERARLFGGHTLIESKPGRGTCIRVDLPLVESMPEEDNTSSDID